MLNLVRGHKNHGYDTAQSHSQDPGVNQGTEPKPRLKILRTQPEFVNSDLVYIQQAALIL